MGSTDREHRRGSSGGELRRGAPNVTVRTTCYDPEHRTLENSLTRNYTGHFGYREAEQLTVR